MGAYRHLQTTSTCRRCGASYDVTVQFKTGSDHEMQWYRPGDVDDDLDAGEYSGIAPACCLSCSAIEQDEGVPFGRRFVDVAVIQDDDDGFSAVFGRDAVER